MITAWLLPVLLLSASAPCGSGVCRCLPFTAEEAEEHADAIFTATVVEVADPPRVDMDGPLSGLEVLGDFDPPARSYTLRGIWGSSAGNVFVVGDSGVVLRYNGTGWTRMTTGTTAQLNDVWGSGANDVYAATASGQLLRFNGTSWSAVSGVQAPGALWSVWGSAANNVYAAGDGR